MDRFVYILHYLEQSISSYVNIRLRDFSEKSSEYERVDDGYELYERKAATRLAVSAWDYQRELKKKSMLKQMINDEIDGKIIEMDNN